MHFASRVAFTLLNSVRATFISYSATLDVVLKQRSATGLNDNNGKKETILNGYPCLYILVLFVLKCFIVRNI